MSENAYGTRSGDGNEGGSSPVSDQQVSEPQGSQPEAQEPQGNEQAITPQYLKEMEQRIIEEATRRAQSMTDKMGSRLDKEIQTALSDVQKSVDLAEKSGVKLTEAQKQAMRDRAINDTYSRMNESSDASSSQSSDQTPQDKRNQPGNDPWVWVNQEVLRLMDQTGVHISPEEANKMIVGDDPQNVTPYTYLKAFEGLITQRQQNTSQPQGLNPAVPSYVTGGRSSKSKSALQNEYDQQISLITKGKHPTIVRGDHMGLQKLKNAYRQKGLDI